MCPVIHPVKTGWGRFAQPARDFQFRAVKVCVLSHGNITPPILTLFYTPDAAINRGRPARSPSRRAVRKERRAAAHAGGTPRGPRAGKSAPHAFPVYTRPVSIRDRCISIRDQAKFARARPAREKDR